jgi:hypothetical protein
LICEVISVFDEELDYHVYKEEWLDEEVDVDGVFVAERCHVSVEIRGHEAEDEDQRAPSSIPGGGLPDDATLWSYAH